MPQGKGRLRTSFETIMPLDWYFRTALRDVSTSSVGPAMRVACYAYLTMSAALRPAPATTMVCGEPFFLGALLRLWGSLVNFSRKAGRFARVLGSCHEVVSCMELAMARQSLSRPSYGKQTEQTHGKCTGRPARRGSGQSRIVWSFARGDRP